MGISGINFSGLSTGIDSDSIIQQLLKLESRPITAIQTRQNQLRQQQVALGKISAAVSGLQAAAAKLDAQDAFRIVAASSSDSSVAAVSAQPGALAGTHEIQVLQLARAQRISSAAHSSQTDGLGLSGQILVNGKAVTIASGDSLQAIAASINSAKAGATASVVAVDSSTYRLVIASDNTGSANTLTIADVGNGTIARSGLGLITAGTSLRTPVTNGAASALFSDNATSIATQVGLTAPAAGTIQINGVDVAIDLGTDSLMSIAGKINVAGISGVSAAVVSATDPATGTTMQRLEITGASTPTFADDQNILTTLGVLKHSVADELVTAQDAEFKLNGLTLTRSSNTVTDAVSGLTITLLKQTGQPTANITVRADTETIKANISAFVSAFNQLKTTHQDVASFDPQTLATGPLFGDTTVQTLVDSLTDLVTGAVPGLPNSTAALSQIGISLSQAGLLNLDDAALTQALTTRLPDVARLFRATGTNVDTRISFLAATEKTLSSGAMGYAVEITAAPTRATMTAGTAHTADDNPDTEILNFSGGPFGAQGRGVIIAPNSTLDGIIAQINSHSVISLYVTASRTGDSLTLTAKQYGAQGGFTVVSTQMAAANNTGIGTDPVSVTGVDVAGTINGEAATGRGQILAGNAGNANTDGLQVLVNSTVTGTHGSLVFSKGVGNLVKYMASSATDFLNGSLSTLSNDLNTRISEMQTEITDLQERLKARETFLRQQFGAMEAAVARIRSASAGLAALGVVVSQSSKQSS
jgi:flagellar hook-associated protein 2